MGKDLKGKELGVGLSQRKDGMYQARYKDRWGNRKYIYDRNLNELRKELAIKVAENELYISVRQNITLNQWFERWLELYKINRVRPSTLSGYKTIYRVHISPYIGERYINSLVKSDVQELIDITYNKGNSYETQHRIRCVMHDMLERALEDNLVSRNAAKGVQLLSKKKKETKCLTVDEQKRFLDYAKNDFYENYFYVALNTGLRGGELAALKEDDINFEENYIRVDETLSYCKNEGDEGKKFHLGPPKTDCSIRTVPMNNICLLYIKRQLKLKKMLDKKYPKNKCEFLFTTSYNTPLNSQIIGDAIKRIITNINMFCLEEEKMKGFHGHVFRHTFATRCFESGIPPKVVQSYLGHATLQMTMNLYVEVMDDVRESEIEKISNIAPNIENIMVS